MPAARVIFVDHGEAYGNLGEEAMILNGLARLQRYLSPRQVYLTHRRNQPLPVASHNGVASIPSPFPAFEAAVRRWEARFEEFENQPAAQRWLTRARRRWPNLQRWTPLPGDLFYWRLVAWLDRWIPSRSGLRESPEVARFLATLDRCAVYYHVGMAGLNEFWEPGLVFKRWVLRQARRRVKLVVLSSQGLGPVARPRARKQMRALLRQAHIISLRDNRYGKELLASFRLRRVSARIVFDEAFSLPAADAHIAYACLRKAGLCHADRFIAFHYRHTDYTGNCRDPVQRVAGLARLAHTVTGLKILFVPMSYAEHSGIDLELGRRLAAQLANPAWFHLLPECQDARVIKAVVRRAEFGLGLSYHLAVFSLTQNRPALILFTGGYYELKSEGLVGFYGPPSCALNLDKVTPQTIASRLRDIMLDYEPACRRIAEVNLTLQKDNDWTLQEIQRRMRWEKRPSTRTSAFRNNRPLSAKL